MSHLAVQHSLSLTTCAASTAARNATLKAMRRLYPYVRAGEAR